MKHFVSNVLATIVGVVIASVICLFLSISLIGSLVSGSEKSEPVVPSSASVLKIDMRNLTVADRTSEDIQSILNAGSNSTVELYDAVRAIRYAATDPAIKYIYIRPDSFSCGTSDLEELRQALSDFRSSGKAVVAYSETLTTGGYYLASVADKVYMTNALGATTMMTGVSGQMFFLKDLLDRLGIKIQLIRHGKYKSAGEMFIRNSASKENMYQQEQMIKSIWNSLASQICESRGVTRAHLDALINDLALCIPQDFVDAGLVDELMSIEDMEAKLADLAVVPSFKQLSMIPLDQYAAARVKTNYKVRNKIAVVYASGNIVDGDSPEQVSGDYYVPILRQIREDSSIKAVVLRVNSPGGSVLASEKIRAEIDLIQQEKPVVASYGNYAASGGYWISSGCQKVFSNATTLTGSIGVFSTIPDVSETLENIAHVNVTSVNSHPHGDMYSMTRPLSEAEKAYMQRSVEVIYDKFLDVVSAGRPLTTAEVDELGQGRVWTGAEALDVKLVDEIGTLSDAISYAASLAGDPELANWRVQSYPGKITFAESLSALFASATGDYTPSVTLARMPFDIVIK